MQLWDFEAWLRARIETGQHPDVALVMTLDEARPKPLRGRVEAEAPPGLLVVFQDRSQIRIDLTA